MTDKKEFVANSLKEAIQKAAEDLDIQEDKLKYRIITEKTKYFGHKQREIFIEAWRSDGSEQQGLEHFIRLLLDEMKVDLRFKLENKEEFRELPQEKRSGAERPGPPLRAPGAAQRQGRGATRDEPVRAAHHPHDHQQVLRPRVQERRR
jgi:hypothetical protein